MLSYREITIGIPTKEEEKIKKHASKDQLNPYYLIKKMDEYRKPKKKFVEDPINFKTLILLHSHLGCSLNMEDLMEEF